MASLTLLLCPVDWFPLTTVPSNYVTSLEEVNSYFVVHIPFPIDVSTQSFKPKLTSYVLIESKDVHYIQR